VDLEKVYDMIPRELLCPVIKKMGIPQEMLVLIKKMYAKNEAQVKIGNTKSADFTTNKGLKQGCGLSPSLLKVYLKSVLYKRNKKCKSMGLPTGNETVHHIFLQMTRFCSTR